MRLRLGPSFDSRGRGPREEYSLPAQHLVTHAVVTGMTGSGKTGLLFVLVEEALRQGVPVLMVDVKGDLTNLLLAFESRDAGAFAPWIDPLVAESAGQSVESLSESIRAQRDSGLARAGIHPEDVTRFREATRVRLLTPGTTAGEPVHLLSSLERRSPLWDSDEEAARESLSSAVSLLLRLVGRDADPARSREHVLLSVLAERRLREGLAADLPALLDELETPPIERIGAMPLDRFVSKKDRNTLAAALNALVASPSFASWRTGAALDVSAWLTPSDERTPATIGSVAHLDDEERRLVLGLLLDEVLSFVRAQPGTSALRALVVLDEVYGMLPPHPANPPTKRPLVALMKQARAFGVGVVLATQNPMDLDYRALSNAGLWCIGRLQTDADRERVVDGLSDSDASATANGASREELNETIKRLGKRWFLVRNAHQGAEGTRLLQPRQTISWLRGPLTRHELRRLLAVRDEPRPTT
ncbi:MAG: helicase HerA-like domain-containing protein [Polyangiales bacterium]